jgi:hypothetical protein
LATWLVGGLFFPASAQVVVPQGFEGDDFGPAAGELLGTESRSAERTTTGDGTSATVRGAAAGELIALTSDAPGLQQVTVLDAKRRVVGVYHVDHATGRIELKSVRRIDWDLSIEEFNAAEPLPRDVRAMLGAP